MRIGASIPVGGEEAIRRGPRQAAAQLEAAGFDSVWVADRLASALPLRSRYPFSADGRPRWEPETPFLESITSMAMAIAGTDRVEVGLAALVLPLRHPLVIARQLATLDALSGGRVVVGVGAGWMTEEFAAVGITFESRGRRLEEAIGVIRDCWSGAPSRRSGGFYPLPANILTNPKPTGPPQILVAGNTQAAIQRAARQGDGWLPLQTISEFDLDWVERAAEHFHLALTSRPGFAPRIALRLVGNLAELKTRNLAQRLSNAGITDLIVDADWSNEDGPGKIQRLARQLVGNRRRPEVS